MASSLLRTARFLGSWITGRSPVTEREAECRDGDDLFPATLYAPAAGPTDGAGWIVLHGITRPGRAHPTLVRFARALASSGARVVVPEIEAWTELRLAPERTVPAVRGALRLLEADTGDGGSLPGLVGFSFGAPQVVLASLDPELRGRLAGVTGFGGYCDLERTVTFQFTGEHTWEGRTHHHRPDPYGRWVIGANYLTGVPEHGDADDVARALWRLAALAGERRIESWDPRYDPVKAQLREEIAPRRRGLFDLFAPPADGEPERGEAEDLIPRLAAACRAASPLMDPGPLLPAPPSPVRLVHGRNDHLIPFTATLRLRRAFPEGSDVDATVTGLFAHSDESPLRAGIEAIREAGVFVRALGDVLGLP